jgi:cysteinyl-tRNA synthetase
MLGVAMKRWLASSAVLVALLSCANWPPDGDRTGSEYREHMRQFVQDISAYAKAIDPSFAVVPQNGNELVTYNEDTASPADDYLAAIDGMGREDLFYGYEADDEPTPEAERDEMFRYLDFAAGRSVVILVTDYCSTVSRMADSYAQNASRGYVSFAADSRELDQVPAYPADAFGANADDVTDLSGAKNFLYLLNQEQYPTKADYLNALANTNHDLLIIDLHYQDLQLSAAEVASLKTKKDGGSRLVVAYMSIGEAEDYRYYWDPSWDANPPHWLLAENPDWPGNYKVRYWDPEWQEIIFGSAGSYAGKILDAGFDGVYLDLIDAFEYFE